MSDIEDYDSNYNSDSDSDSDSDSENYDNGKINRQIKKPILTNTVDDILESNSESEEDSDEENEINDDEQYGGADEELEEGELAENSDDENDVEIEEVEQVVSGKNVKTKVISKPLIINNDEDEDDEDEDDESYLQKFDKDMNKNYINEFHPECIISNYDEVAILSRVIRDKDNIIIDPLHKTIPYLTKYEKARILGQRAKQIESGAKPFIKVPENIIDGYIIAELELQQKRIPFIIRRPLPGGGSEYWNIKDLEIINF
jgi:DNA-directed RNA polymerase subunit K/omega